MEAIYEHQVKVLKDILEKDLDLFDSLMMAMYMNCPYYMAQQNLYEKFADYVEEVEIFNAIVERHYATHYLEYKSYVKKHLM